MKTINEIGPDDIQPDFVSEEERYLFAEAKLGEEAVSFLGSELGQLLKARAEEDMESAKQDLLDTDPTDASAIREAQFKARVAGQFLAWMADAIRNGDQAFQQLKQLEQ